MFKLYKFHKINIINKIKAQMNLICEIINLCTPKKIKNYPLNILIIYRHNYRKSLKKCGVEKDFNLKRAYPFRGIAIHRYKNKKYYPLVIITIPKQSGYIKINGDKKRGYLSMTLFGNIEEFVACISYELYHCFQGVVKINFNETEADRYALSCLKKWRKRN
jgi:hypothetical protein